MFIPLYELMLPIPHADKQATEDAVVAVPSGLLKHFIVRPALFTDGQKGSEGGICWESTEGGFGVGIRQRRGFGL